MIESAGCEREVKVGDFVRVRDGSGIEEQWRIVAEHEADVMRKRISEGTPLALAVLGHVVGDVVTVRSPERRRVRIDEIVDIHVDD
jgi:transcription elongation GreA/GreB family factor